MCSEIGPNEPERKNIYLQLQHISRFIRFSPASHHSMFYGLSGQYENDSMTTSVGEFTRLHA